MSGYQPSAVLTIFLVSVLIRNTARIISSAPISHSLDRRDMPIATGIGIK